MGANFVVTLLFLEFLQIISRNGISLMMARSQNARWMMMRYWHLLLWLFFIIFWCRGGGGGGGGVKFMCTICLSFYVVAPVKCFFLF